MNIRSESQRLRNAGTAEVNSPQVQALIGPIQPLVIIAKSFDAVQDHGDTVDSRLAKIEARLKAAGL